VCANVNTAPLLDADIPWNYVAKGGSRNIPTAAFFEGGINLDAFFGEAPCFSNVVAETRSSFEVNAVLKDLVHSRFQLCGANIEITPDDVNGGAITPTSDTCADPGTVGGTCSVTVSSNVAGPITGHAEADVDVGDTVVHVETGGVGNNPDATKRFVDGRVSITPDDVNGIGESHTFVVDAEQNIGSGFVAATDGHADVTLVDAGGAVNLIDTAASTCDDAGDNLDANGQCTITFTSNTTGTVTGHATVSINITTAQGNITITRETDGAAGNSDDAAKEFVDGSLAWLKNDDKGARLGGATFEVCRTHTLDTSTNPDTFIDSANVCVTVLDNSASDADPDVVTANLTLQPGPKDVTLSEAFVNRASTGCS